MLARTLGGLLALGGVRVATAAPTPLGQAVAWPTVTLLDGRTLGAAELRGRAVVVTIFSTDCPYCLRHNRRLDRLARATREQPLTVLAAALDRDRSPVEAYLAREGHGFAVTMDGPALREVLTARQVKPITAVIDRRGVLRELIPGEMAEDDVMGLAKWAQG